MQVISKISVIQSKTPFFSLVVKTYLRNTRGKLLSSVTYTSGDTYDHVCITEKYDFIVNVSCKHMCHVVKGLIHFGIATETPKGTKNKHQSLMGMSLVAR